MISFELKKIIEQLRKQGHHDFVGNVTVKQIEQFEKDKDVTLPSQYKEWLQYSDGGCLFLPGGVQFYGVGHLPLINEDDDDRPDDSFIVIGALATGDPILCKKDGEEVCIYNHEAGRIESDERYPDFFSFLDDLYDLLGIGD